MARKREYIEIINTWKHGYKDSDDYIFSWYWERLRLPCFRFHQDDEDWTNGGPTWALCLFGFWLYWEDIS